MSRSIIIGKQGNQPFPIPDTKVSRQHAVLYVGDDGTMMLVDTKSTNGTYIYNGHQFIRLVSDQRYPVNADTMIQLGTETRFHVRKLLGNFATPGGAGGPGVGPRRESPKAPVKKIDIKHLRAVSEKFNENKMRLESKSGVIGSMRSATIVISLCSSGLSQVFIKVFDMGDLMGWVCALFFAVILFLTLQAIINSYNNKIIKARAANEKEYSVKYCCPECGYSFRGKPYENVLSERKCPRCKSEYYDSSEKR